MIERLLAIALIATAGCAADKLEAAEDNGPGLTSEPPAPRGPEFTGVITTRDSQVVAADFDGRVIELFVTGGQRVRRGDPIARLDSTRVRKQLAAARAAEDAARADMGRAGVQVRAAKRQIRLERRLYRRGAASRERIRQANFDRASSGAGYGAAAAAHRKAVAERQQLEDHLENAILKAPIDGVVSMIRVTEGEMARPGTPVARVFDPRDLRLRFAINHEHRNALRKGDRVRATIEATNATFEARVENISTDLEPPLQFVVADADIDDDAIDHSVIGVNLISRVQLVDR